MARNSNFVSPLGQPAPDLLFAKRSAKYLRSHGLRNGEITTALVDELDLRPDTAEEIVLDLAA